MDAATITSEYSKCSKKEDYINFRNKAIIGLSDMCDKMMVTIESIGIRDGKITAYGHFRIYDKRAIGLCCEYSIEPAKPSIRIYTD